MRRFRGRNMCGSLSLGWLGIVCLLLLAGTPEAFSFVGMMRVNIHSRPTSRDMRCGFRLSASASTGDIVPQAIQRCRQAVEKDPKNEEAWFLLGVLLQENGDRQGAKDSFVRCTEINPSREAALLNLAMLEQDTSLPQALQACVGALKANAKSYEAYTLMGDIMHRAAKLDAAMQAYRSALKIEPTALRAHTGLVRALLSSGNTESARVAATRAVDALPRASLAHSSLGLVLLELGRITEAKRSFEAALDLDKNNGEAHNGLGIVYSKQGAKVSAEEYYKTAAILLPNSAEPLYNLAVLYLEAGASERSKVDGVLRQALAICPDHQGCLLMLASLGRSTTGPTTVPLDHITSLFDSIADAYNLAVVPAVSYKGPAVLLDAVASIGILSKAAQSGRSTPQSVMPLDRTVARVKGGLRQSEMGSFMQQDDIASSTRAETGKGTLAIADIGCGTGLCGTAFADWAQTLQGCDISPRMVELASSLGVYTNVEVSSADVFLSEMDAQSLDLILAGDVMPYVGDMSLLMKKAARALKPGGVFAFTTEELGSSSSPYPPQGYTLNSFTRFCHSKDYIRTLAQECGFTIEYSSSCALRLQGVSPIPAQVYCLRLLQV